MKRRSLPWLAGLVLALLPVLIIAQPGNSLGAASTNLPAAPMSQSAHYNLSWDAIGSGGGVISSPNYRLRHTIGQPSVGDMNAPNYAIHAGYWQWFYRKVFLPLILR
jgi:hypothetical protein